MTLHTRSEEIRVGAVDPRRTLPSVEQVLQTLGELALPRVLVVTEIRRLQQALRREGNETSLAEFVGQLRGQLDALGRTRLQEVVNGTGILLHTNFGRAPLSDAAIAAMTTAAANYSNLEYDLETGERGGRGAYVEQLLAQLTGAEAATVVNNCAAALVLVLRYFSARKPEVLISRGELVQIGGGFRIPEILEASGAVLREVGTTNQTSLDDYAQAVTQETGLILKVHRSNFHMDGFVASPSTGELARLARSRGVALVEDLGSGAVFATEDAAGLDHEPTPAETLSQGVDLVTFSGDKLLGGPQAGIIAGRAGLVEALKREPFFRALRCDKLVFAALQATAEAHLTGAAAAELPLQQMLRVSVATLRRRAERLRVRTSGASLSVTVVDSIAEVGGGSLPRSRLASVALRLETNRCAPSELHRRLARAIPPVIGMIVRDSVQIDLRTVFPRQDEYLAACLKGVAADVSGREDAGDAMDKSA